MNKQNKILAQERRAKEREKAAKKAKISKAFKFWAPIVAVVIVVIVLVWAVATSGTSSSSSDESTTTTSTESTMVESTETSATEESSTLNTEEGLVAEDGDTVNIDYTGYIDGEAFDGGSTNGAGADLTLGSGSYIDGFEDAVVGHSVGETFDINVTFPDDYYNDEYAGKDATFEITLNGIYE